MEKVGAHIPPSPPCCFWYDNLLSLISLLVNYLNVEVDMCDVRQELTGWGEIVWGEKTYKKIYYKITIEKEANEDEEPDIYGTLNDKRGDKFDIAEFVGTSDKLILNLSDGRYLNIVFLDESGEFEVDGGFKNK